MQLIGTILQYIFIGIFKFFKFVWIKWKLAGILAVFFIIELMILIPVYENSVNDISRTTVRNYEIAEVEQSDLPRYKGRIIVTIDNKSSDNMNGPSSATVEVGGEKYYMMLESNYRHLDEQGYNFYRGNIIPAGTSAKVIYSFGDYNVAQELPHGHAKLFIDDYYNDVIKEYEFELKPTMETTDAPEE